MSVSVFSIHFTSKSVDFVYCRPKQSDCRQFGRPSHWKGLSRSLRGGSLYIGRRWRSYAGWTQRGTKNVSILFFFFHKSCFLKVFVVRRSLHISVFYFHLHLNSVTFSLHVKVLASLLILSASFFFLPLVFVWKVSLQLRMWELWPRKWWRSVSWSLPHVCPRWSSYYTTCKTGNRQWSVEVSSDIYYTSHVNICNFMKFVDRALFTLRHCLTAVGSLECSHFLGTNNVCVNWIIAARIWGAFLNKCL